MDYININTLNSYDKAIYHKAVSIFLKDHADFFSITIDSKDLVHTLNYLHKIKSGTLLLGFDRLTHQISSLENNKSYTPSDHGELVNVFNQTVNHYKNSNG